MVRGRVPVSLVFCRIPRSGRSTGPGRSGLPSCGRLSWPIGGNPSNRGVGTVLSSRTACVSYLSYLRAKVMDDSHKTRGELGQEAAELCQQLAQQEVAHRERVASLEQRARLDERPRCGICSRAT